MTSSPLDETIDFFTRNNIPILPLHGINDEGTCTCRLASRCPSPGKHPLMKKWQMLATTDKSKILAWIGTGKKPVNLGIATGRFNQKNGKYLVTVDLDEVDHSLLGKLNAHGRTVTQRSGGGGDHALYWSKYPIKNSVELVDEKVDIRGQGGLLVIAPSKHVSGRRYEFSCDPSQTEIQDIPEFLERSIRIASADLKKKAAKVAGEPKAKKSSSPPDKFWSKLSVPEIREKLTRGDMIPLGARNNTMHRLLSSDRAKGTMAPELRTNALSYLKNFQDSENFVEEIETIVGSVVKYPAYNNSFERVNEVYMTWLKKNGHKNMGIELETLNNLDSDFFGQIERGSDLDGGLSLYHIAQAREDYLKARGLKNFATYKLQLLAKKLESMGFSKKKTSRGNVWIVRLGKKRLNSVQLAHPVCENGLVNSLPSVEKLSMSTEELKDEEKKKGLKNGDVIDYQGRKVRVEIETYQTKVKEHSHEHLYLGRTGYDYNKALMALMSRITEEQVDLLESNQLVMDPEKTKAWLGQVKPGDVIGVKCHRLMVTGTASDGLQVVLAANVRGEPGKFTPDPKAEESFVTLPELDHARELGLLEVLWRDEKPFGEPATTDMRVVFLHDIEAEKAAAAKAKKPKIKTPKPTSKKKAPMKQDAPASRYNQVKTTKKKVKKKTSKK